MQTFLPSFDFAVCAHSLDARRLRKQLVEGCQILQYLVDPTASKLTVSQRHHPVFGYWHHDSPAQLLGYLATCVAELCNRSPVYHVPDLYKRLLNDYGLRLTVRTLGKVHPRAVHLSHQCALVHKDYAYYHPQFPNALPILNYIWYNRQTGTYYTGQRSVPKTVHDLGPWPLVDEWHKDCERRGLMRFPAM